MGNDHPFTKRRWEEIERIIKSGKVVRFHYGPFYKDVNSLEGEEVEQPEGCEEKHFDLVAFRQSGGKVPHVCWESPDLRIEEVDP